MMVKREVGGFIADSLHSHPSEAPSWALVGSLIPRCQDKNITALSMMFMTNV